MKQTLLTDWIDLQWLQDVHLSQSALPPFAVALVNGSEDWPDSIVLYQTDDVNSPSLTLTPNENGDFVYSIPQFTPTGAN